MDIALNILLLVLIISLIVIIHELAHAVAARCAGMRVSEIFLGLPLGPRLSFENRRSGVRYGVSLALLGGYTRVCGMGFEYDERMPLVLALVSVRGSLTVDGLRRVLGCDDDDAIGLLMQLESLGCVERSGEDELEWRTPRRDALGLTALDRGHDFALPGGTRAGEPFFPKQAPDEFFELELARTYAGKGFLARALVLLAGIVANILTALFLAMAIYMFQGTYTLAPTVVQVDEGSSAAAAGIREGDVIASLDGMRVQGVFNGLSKAMLSRGDSDEVEVTYLHQGEAHTVRLTLDDDGYMGTYFSYALDYPGPLDALRMALSYVGQTGAALLGMLVPGNAQAVLSDSMGIVGITAVVGEVASEQGAWGVVSLVAALSLSLGWINLLPLPPMDGGKLVIEAVQAIRGRPFSLSAQAGLSMAGMALILVLFFVVLFQDVSRLMGGGF